MKAKTMTEVLTAVALVVLVIAIVIMSLAIFDSIEKFGDEVRDFFKGKD
jgi:hypothetical protein